MKIVPGILIIAVQVFFFASFLWRAEKTTSEFPVYYSAARLWSRGENPYSLQAQCAEMAALKNGRCFPLAHPPILLPSIALVSSDNFVASYWRWNAILILVLIACFWFVWSISGNAQGSAQSLLFYPTMFSLFYGNDSAFVLLAVVSAAWLLLKKKRDLLAGLALSLCVLKPHLAIVLALPLPFARRQMFLGFCIGGAALTLLSFALVGVDGFKGIVDLTLLMAKGEGYGIGHAYMVNTTGILSRAGLTTVWAWPLYALAIIALCVLWNRFGASIATLSLSIIAALFFTPHVHNYELGLLAIPLVIAHRLGPLIASLIMVIAIPVFSPGYWGAFSIMLPLALYYARRLQLDQNVSNYLSHASVSVNALHAKLS